MKTLIFINSLKPGKLKEYQAFSNENKGPRKKEYIDLLHRYGLKNTKVYYNKFGNKELIIVVHDAEDDAEERIAHFATSKHPYDIWFKKQLENLHDFMGESSELLLDFDPKTQKVSS